MLPKSMGRPYFIGGALPGEHVTFVIHKEKKQFAEAQVEKVLKASSERVEPACCYFDTCGGCSLQHVSFGAQVALKQRILEEQLERIGKVKPEIILPPLYGYSWYYRDRARLSVAVDKKGRLKLGFQAKKAMMSSISAIAIFCLSMCPIDCLMSAICCKSCMMTV